MKIFSKISLFIAITMMLISGCSEDFIDQKPTSVVTELTYYKTVDELESGLVAAYSRLWDRSPLFWGFEECIWSFGNIGSDDAEKGGENETDSAPLGDVSFSRQTATNLQVNYMWTSCYLLIARCNQVIDQSANTTGDATAIAKIVNQAKFLRGMTYYHLVTLFGDVPLVTKFLGPSELTLERTPAAQVWVQIESDLKDATSLPARSAWKQSGRADSGTAWTLLGKVYLTQKKYTEAKDAFKKVIDSNEYQLVSDYGKICRKEGENCEESIFEFQLKNGLSGGDMGNFSGILRLSRDAGAGGWGFDCPTQSLVNEFEAGDPRSIYTIIYPGDVFPTAKGNYVATNTRSPSGYHNRKAWIPDTERAGKSMLSWDFNFRYMRYAEVLLLYAECLNETDNQSAALTYINMIRARARNTPAADPQRISSSHSLVYTGQLLPDVTTTNKAELRAAIWHEQRVELGMEAVRRYSLLRTDRFKTQMEAAKGAKGCTVEAYEVLLPIPQTEIELSNKKITQNTGY